jgi:hypothetical protein
MERAAFDPVAPQAASAASLSSPAPAPEQAVRSAAPEAGPRPESADSTSGTRASAGPAVGFRLRVPAVLQPGDVLAAEIAAVDAFGQPAEGFSGAVQVYCLTEDGRADFVCRRVMAGATLRLEIEGPGAAERSPSAAAGERLRVEGAGVAWLCAVDLTAGLAGLSHSFEVTEETKR